MVGCTETVTLVKCDGEVYTATVIEGVSWFDKVQVKLESAGLVFANATKVRIPADSIPAVLPETGDQLIRGTLPLGLTVEKPADLAPYHPRKIMAVGDNRRGRLAHLAVVCQ